MYTQEDIDILADEIERLRKCLRDSSTISGQCIREARPHVVRQQFAGKHEQDRIDAVEWLKKWGHHSHNRR